MWSWRYVSLTLVIASPSAVGISDMGKEPIYENAGRVDVGTARVQARGRGVKKWRPGRPRE